MVTQKLLSVIRQISGNEFVFQQDSAPAHGARETIELLRRETRRTLFHRNSGHRTVQILIRLITKSRLQCSSASTRRRLEMLTNCDSVCWTFGAALNKTSSTPPLTSGKVKPWASYYGRRIGNRTQAFEWYQFEWPWVSTNPDFNVTILFNVK